jgi:gliding motility-associated-like protein
VFTPNNDGKNDYFEVIPLGERVEIVIFNRWGILEYTNSNYTNNWDGRNNKGKQMPDDTYFYVVKFEDGTVKKGTVLIKR